MQGKILWCGMAQKNIKRTTGCPVAFGLDIFGDRWTLIIIRDIMIKGIRTYSGFLESDEKIATNILVDRLKLLEAEGIVEKSRDPENRRSFIYTLTQKGRELAPVLIEIIKWSGVYDTRPFALKETSGRIRKDRQAFEYGLLNNTSN